MPDDNEVQGGNQRPPGWQQLPNGLEPPGFAGTCGKISGGQPATAACIQKQT
ncbi:MAG: hypothetical protein GY696_20695 [Gammaproteobacteria bacterium]|nr:hypothetical protein [Gammaproteobacteria bacterium]